MQPTFQCCRHWVVALKLLHHMIEAKLPLLQYVIPQLSAYHMGGV